MPAKKVIFRTVDGKKVPLTITYKGWYEIPQKELVNSLEELYPNGRVGSIDEQGRIIRFGKTQPIWAKEPSYYSQLITMKKAIEIPKSRKKKDRILNPLVLIKKAKRQFGFKSLFGKSGKPVMIKRGKPIEEKPPKAKPKKKRSEKRWL